MLLLSLLLAATPLDQGEAAYASGDYATALVQWSLAYDDAREAGDHDAADAALLRLSTTYRQLGRLKEAEGALDLVHDKTPGLDVGRGLLAMELGDLERAEKHFARAFFQAQKEEDVQTALNAAVDLGLARMHQGDLDGADKALQAALVLAAALEDPVATADVRNDLGLLARRGGDLRSAQALLEDAVLLYRAADHAAGEAEELLGAAYSKARSRSDLVRQARILEGHAGLAFRRGDSGEALSRYRLALEAWEGAGRTDEVLVVRVHIAAITQDPAAFSAVLASSPGPRTEALARLNLGVLTEDAQLLQEALGLAERFELHGVRWKASAALGQRLFAEGDLSGAIPYLRAAVDELERARRSLDEDEAALFLVDKHRVYEDLIAALLSQGDSAGAFLYAQRLQLASLPALPIEESAELSRYQALQDREAWLAERLAVAPEDSEEARALRERLAALHVEFAATVDELRASYPDFDQAVWVDPDDLEAVQADLDPGVLVLQPLLLGDQLVLLVVSRTSLRAVPVDVDRAVVERTLSRLTRSLRAQMIDDEEWTRSLCETLGGWLIAPIREEVAAAEVLVVSPTGAFQQLPFALLRDDGRWLIEDVPVASVTHVGTLRARGPREAGYHLDGRDLLLIGNPDGSLPEAEYEVRAIAAGQPGSTLLVGSLGGREQLVEYTPEMSTLHLATHGIVDPQHPERSYLVIGDASLPTGRLTYGEIPGLAPYLSTARLVVLSACESGLPVKAPEAEGSEVAISINGLSAQFRRAGVETLVASMWKVDDEGTRRLMEGFYGNLAAGQDVAEALRNSQLSLLGDEELGHPWFWASFVVMGDWR